MTLPLRLGVNIDHVATLRNARGGIYPDPIRAAHLAQSAGCDGITAHIREDRRHIKEDDIFRLMDSLSIPLNLEMAALPEMRQIALTCKPHAVCLVPEKREERTTEGGLDLIKSQDDLKKFIAPLHDKGIRVSLFIEPDKKMIEIAHKIGVAVIELHTGLYCESTGERHLEALSKIQDSAHFAHSLGIECHAGHGLTFDTVPAIAAIPAIVELNIGHFLIGESLFTGLSDVITKMRVKMKEGRSLI